MAVSIYEADGTNWIKVNDAAAIFGVHRMTIQQYRTRGIIADDPTLTRLVQSAEREHLNSRVFSTEALRIIAEKSWSPRALHVRDWLDTLEGERKPSWWQRFVGRFRRGQG